MTVCKRGGRILLFAFLLLYHSVKADTLGASSGNGTDDTASTSWEDAFSTTHTPTATNDVLVVATFSMESLNTGVARTANFRINNASTQSGTISRYLSGNNDKGIGSLMHIFTGQSGATTYTLQHQTNTSGRNVRTAGTIIAIDLQTSAGTDLNAELISLASAANTQSAAMEGITGTQTGSINLPARSHFYVAASIQCRETGIDAATGEWELQYYDGSWQSMGYPISRSMSSGADAGIVSLVGVLQDQAAGDYQFRIAHRRSAGSGQVQTAKAYLAAVALGFATGNTFPTLVSYTSSTSTASTSFVTATGKNVQPVSDDTDVFLHAQYEITGDQQISPASYDLAVDNSILDGRDQARFVASSSDTGAGTSAGLASGLASSTSYAVSLRHHTDGSGGTLTTQDAYLVGLVLRSQASPTYALISSLNTYREGDRLFIDWETAAENATVGYRVYRRASPQEAWQPIGSSLTPVKHMSLGQAHYRIPDPRPAWNTDSVEYAVFEIDATGATRQSRSVRVDMRNPTESPPIDLEKTRPRLIKRITQSFDSPWNASRLMRPKPSMRSFEKPFIRGVHIETERAGLVYVDACRIAAAVDTSCLRIQRLLQKARLRLENLGEPVAMWIQWEGRGIIFYATGRDSPYGDKNIYTLTRGRGVTMQTEPADSNSNRFAPHRIIPRCHTMPIKTFDRVIQIEQDVFPTTALHNDPETDYWVWDHVVAEHPTEGAKHFQFQAPFPVPSNKAALLNLRLQGASDTPANPDHHVRIELNQYTIAETTFEGNRTHAVSMSFDPNLLRDASNQLSVFGLLRPGVTHSTFFVDSFELRYPSKLSALDDQIELTTDRPACIEIEGFHTPQVAVMDITNPMRPIVITNILTTPTTQGHTIRFVAPASGHFWAQALPAQPTHVSAIPPSKLKAGRNAADYLIITGHELLEAAEAWAEYRSQTGYLTKVVTLDQIIAEFGFGRFHPLVLHDFIRYTTTHWRKSPSHVLLAGDGNMDYRGLLTSEPNPIPPWLHPTPYGLFAGDTWLGDTNLDGAPEIAVGRVPAQSSLELLSVLDKVIQYEQSSDFDISSRQAVFAADRIDHAGDFKTTCRQLAEHVSGTHGVINLFLDDMSLTKAREGFIENLRSGAALITYAGHGGIDRLSQAGLFTNQDIPELHNPPAYPLVLILSCVAGRFALPGVTTLGEMLLLVPQAGSVGVLAPSGFAENRISSVFADAFLKHLLHTDTQTVGEALLAAHRQARALNLPGYIHTVYNWLGDPALRLDRIQP